MKPLLRTADAVALFDGNYAALGRTLKLTKVAPLHWGEYLPELRARQLLDLYPELRELVVDPETGLTLKQMREVAKAATAEGQG